MLSDETKTKTAHTPGPWNVARMVSEKTGEPLTPEEIGEYVANTVRVSAGASGWFDFFFVYTETPTGRLDICLVGNGPNGPANAARIVACVEALEGLDPAGVRESKLALEMISGLYESDSQLSADELLKRASKFAGHALAKILGDG